MRIGKRILACLAAVAMALPVIGCGRKTVKVDATKTQLYVYNYDGGVGREWLDNAAEKFARRYAEECFEPGTSKKGVEIIVSTGQDRLTDIKDSPYNVFFTEGVFYNDLASRGQLMPLDDIVVDNPLTDVSSGNDTRSIADKLDAEQKSAFNALGHYYVLPHYESYSGITYDRKVFSEKGLYFKAGAFGEFITPKATEEQEPRTVGPDGVAHTDDDGLPSSVEEFELLLAQMKTRGVVPFIWDGARPDYTNHMLVGMWGALGGKDEFGLNFNFGTGEGAGKTMEIVPSFTGNVADAVQQTEITPATGYLTRQQNALYTALRFLRTVVTNSDYYSTKITGVLSHTDAQREFIYSDLENKPIGMIIEGSYWYNEAENAFKSSENKYKDRAKNRDFAWMPLPVREKGSVSEGNGRKNVLVDALSATCFINNNIRNNAALTALAKKFVRFVYTDELLSDFTVTTGVAKGVNYTIDHALVDGMSNYYRSLYNARQNSFVVRPYSSNAIFVNAQSAFYVLGSGSYWTSTVNNSSYAYAKAAFNAKVSAEDYFKGLWQTSNAWNSRYGNYFGA